MEPQLLTVAEGVHAWIGAGGDSNAGAIDTPHGIVAIDAQQYPRLAQKFRSAIEARTGKPVRMLINTHCHLDHTGGNIVFAEVPISSPTTRRLRRCTCANLGAKSGGARTSGLDLGLRHQDKNAVRAESV